MDNAEKAEQDGTPYDMNISLVRYFPFNTETNRIEGWYDEHTLVKVCGFVCIFTLPFLMTAFFYIEEEELSKGEKRLHQGKAKVKKDLHVRGSRSRCLYPLYRHHQ